MKIVGLFVCLISVTSMEVGLADKIGSNLRNELCTYIMSCPMNLLKTSIFKGHFMVSAFHSSVCQDNAVNMANWANFDDINFDCKQLIFDELDLISLATMARVNGEYHQVAVDVFRQNYAKKEFHINGPHTQFQVKSDERVYITNVTVLSKVFQTFGTLISDVNVSYFPDKSLIREVVMILNRYA